MKFTSLKPIWNLPTGSGFKPSQQFWIFTFCLLISSVFWLLTTLSKDYTTELNFPIEYSALPEDKIVVNELPQQINLEVKSFGFNLLWHKLKGKLTPIKLNADFSDMKQLENRNSEYYFSTSSKVIQIARQIDKELEILRVYPDTLFFNFGKKVNKEVPVNLKQKISFEKGYFQIEAAKLTPASVVISGPIEALDSIQYIATEVIEANDVVDSISFDLKLISPDLPNVKLSVDEVHVLFPVEKFTEASSNIPIEIINAPKNLKIKTFPENVVVVYQVALSRFENVNESSFHAVVNYDDIAKDRNRLFVRLNRSPEYVKSIRIIPEAVEYIIQK